MSLVSLKVDLPKKMMGVIRSVVFGGSMTLLVALMVGTFAPKLRKMEY